MKTTELKQANIQLEQTNQHLIYTSIKLQHINQILSRQCKTKLRLSLIHTILCIEQVYYSTKRYIRQFKNRLMKIYLQKEKVCTGTAIPDTDTRKYFNHIVS